VIHAQQNLFLLNLRPQIQGQPKSFYADALGFAMTDFGPIYSSTMTGDVDLGLQADAKEASRASLPFIRVESLEATKTEVKRAGGVIVKPIFSFPGGRRFHFRDPAGNELAAMQPDSLTG
jgi:predicted enzyme related to lactoylglutathione lyase